MAVMLLLLMEGIYEFAVGMDSDGMIYIPRFMKIGIGI
jgi:hypothetical protein